MPEYAMWTLIVALIMFSFGLSLEIVQIRKRFKGINEGLQNKNRELEDIKKKQEEKIIELTNKITELEKDKSHNNSLKEFTFIDPPGYFTHPKYPDPLCPICLIKNNLKSPVSNGYCTVCKEPISETLKSGGDMFTVPDE